MGNQQPSRFNPYFRSDEFDEIIQQIVMLMMEDRNDNMNAENNNNNNNTRISTSKELNQTLTKDEWNIVSVLCRSSKTTFEHCAQHRARLQTLWADNESPRPECPESSLLFALTCFLEAALGGTDLNSVSNRLINTISLLQSNLEMERNSQNENNKNNNNNNNVVVSEPEKALNWAASIASQNNNEGGNNGNNNKFQKQNLVWNEIARDLRRITLVNHDDSSISSSSAQIMEESMLYKEPVKSWLTCLIIACYCIIVHRMASSSSSTSSGPDAPNASLIYATKVNARSFGFFALSVCYKAKIRSNTITDQLWTILAEYELEENLSTIVSSHQQNKFPLAPIVDTWEDIPKVYVGQSHALRDVGNLLRARREGLVPSDKPTVILLYGPSGYGKTQLGKHISRILRRQSGNANNNNNHTNAKNNISIPDDSFFVNLVEQEQQQALDQQDEDGTSSNAADGSKDLLVLNMANYCTETSLYSLIDPPSGIVGEGGLIRAIQKNPRMVIVADEFEKSTALAINNLWLPAFETNGKLASGKDPLLKVPTKDVTFVLTCNLCDREILESSNQYHAATDEGKQKMRDQWNALCGKKLSEFMQNNAFLPRISKLIPFVPFTNPELEKYVELQVEAFERHQLRRNVQFFYSRSVVERLAKSVKNFHTRSVDAALLDHMLKASDERANAVVLTVATEKPPILLTEAALSDAVFIHNQYEFSPKQNLQSHCGHQSLEKLLAEREKEQAVVKILGDRDAANIRQVIEWMKNDRLGLERNEAVRIVAQEKKKIWNEMAILRNEQKKKHEEDEELQQRQNLQLQQQKKKQDEELQQQKLQQEKEKQEQKKLASVSPVKQNETPSSSSISPKREENTTQAMSPGAAAFSPPSPQQPSYQIQMQNQQPTAKPQLAFQVQLQEKKQIDLESQKLIEQLTVKNSQLELQSAEREDLISELHLQVKEVLQENNNLKLEVKTLKELVKSLRTALALALITSVAFIVMASLFLPLKVVLLTVVAIALTINYFVTNFADIVMASVEALYNYLGPKNIGGIILALILWSLFVGNYYSASPLPCV